MVAHMEVSTWVAGRSLGGVPLLSAFPVTRGPLISTRAECNWRLVFRAGDAQPTRLDVHIGVHRRPSAA